MEHKVNKKDVAIHIGCRASPGHCLVALAMAHAVERMPPCSGEAKHKLARVRVVPLIQRKLTMPSAAHATPAPFDPRSRSSYSHFERVTIRFADLDTLGHVNNIAFNAYVEQARVMFWRPFLAQHGDDRIDTIVVRVAVDYFAELSFPGAVDVGARVSRIGTKSLVLQSPVFLGDKCHALGESVIALFDKVERKTVAPPAEFRAALERQMRGEVV